MSFYVLLALICCMLTMLDKARDLQIVAVGDNVLYRRFHNHFGGYSCAVLLLLLVAFLRRPDLGSDSSNYIIFFDNALQGVYPTTEWGFNTLTKIFILFSSSYQLFIVLCSVLTLVPIFFVIKREISQYRWLAVFSFIMTQYAASFSVLRGYLSLAFVFLAYRHLSDRKRYAYWFYMLAALLFHVSSAVFIVLFLLGHRKYKVYHYCIVFAASALFIPTPIRVGIFSFLGRLNGRYSGYAAAVLDYHGSFVFLCIFIVLTVLSVIYYKPLLNRNPKNIVLINICIAMLIFCICFTWFPASSRIVLPCLAFMCMLIPEIVACERDILIRSLLIIFFCALFVVFIALNLTQSYAFLQL